MNDPRNEDDREPAPCTRLLEIACNLRTETPTTGQIRLLLASFALNQRAIVES